MLKKHRSSDTSETEVSSMIDDDRSNNSAELPSMGKTPVVKAMDAASRTAPGFRYDPTLEHKLRRTQIRAELASTRLNQINGAGGNVKNAKKALDDANAELAALLFIADPAQLLDEVMSNATRKAHEAYNKALSDFETTVKAGYGKHCWNLVAGGTGNFIAFGIGGLIGTGTGSPLASLSINTLLWTFTEPLISMMRATTFTNPSLDLYMVRQRLQGRAVREALDGTSQLERNRRFAWEDPVSQETTLLSAADWLKRSSWLDLWSGKYVTDDVLTYLYTLAYGITNSLPEFTSADLYETAGTGIWIRAGIRTSAGVAAGAALQECAQLLRASQAERTGGKELVTKTTALWSKEALVVRMILDDIERKQADIGLTTENKQAYATLHRSFTLWHRKAVAKSCVLSSICYEWGAMLQSKREAIGIDPEVPGKRMYTAASFIGKGLAQLPGMITSQIASSVVRSPVPWIGWTGYLVPPLAMIGAFGFIARRELEVIAHTMLSAAHGLGRRCCPCDAED